MNFIVSLIVWFSIVATIPADAFSSRKTANHHGHLGSSTSTSIRETENKDSSSIQERRSFLGNLAWSIPMFTFPVASPSAHASGGATAGGAYLLSAKQRYNERVKASVQGLLQVADGLKAGDSKLAKEYFANEEGGSWKDLTAAGYLLSNAFRRNSTAAPDTLPAVKVCLLFDLPRRPFLKQLIAYCAFQYLSIDYIFFRFPISCAVEI
jgi:hypothetical protein